MSFLDFGLGLSPPWEGGVEACPRSYLDLFRCCSTLEEVQDSMSETERSERLGARKKKKSTRRKKPPPRESNDKGVYLSDPRDPPPVVKSKGGAGLYPVQELEALNLDSSDDSESSGDELDEEAAKYEEERYHPDDHIQNSKKPRRRQFQTALSQVVPSAPPPYEMRPKSYSFLLEKVKRKLRLAFPIVEGIEGERMHAPMEYNQIKELAESVRKYGVTANFTLAQLDRLALNALTI
ncbi:hypothetical protein NN561_012641 [Cricetulus griseus]